MSTDGTPTPTRGVLVEGLDKPRRLRYTFATRRKMIEALGSEEKLETGLTGEDLCTVLLFGFQHEDPSLTLAQLEDMIDMENLSTVVTAMSKALGYKGKAALGINDPTAEGGDPTTAAADSAKQ